jgi:hypothetical protein
MSAARQATTSRRPAGSRVSPSSQGAGSAGGPAARAGFAFDPCESVTVRRPQFSASMLASASPPLSRIAVSSEDSPTGR